MQLKQRFTITRSDILATGGLIGLVLLLVAPALLPGRALIPFDIVTEAWPPWQQPNQPIEVNNMLLADAVNYIVPVKRLLSESVREGHLPLWNPYVLGGYPFTYNTQAGAFYPLTALYYVLPLMAAVDLTIVLQMILGALFMYAFLRHSALSEIAAFAGAVIFTFNGLMLIWLEWQVVHAAIIWLPLQLLLVDRIVVRAADQGPSRSKGVLLLSILCGVTLAIPWLGGHWNWTLYNSMTLLAYVLWRLGPLLRRMQSSNEKRALVLAVAIIFVVGLGLAMIQLLPAFRYLSQSHRQPFTFAEARERALLNRFVVSLVPKFFGTPVDDNWWGPRNFAETTFYVGILPLFLTTVAAFTRKNSRSTFFLVWGIIGLLWSLGEPAYRILHVLPIFNGFFPSRAVIIPIVAVSVLAPVGLDFLLKAPPEERRKLGWLSTLTFFILAIIGGAYYFYYRAEVSRNWGYLRDHTLLAAFLLLLAFSIIQLRLKNQLNARLFASISVIFIIVDLFLFGRGYNTISSTSDWFPNNAVTSFLAEDDQVNRILTTASGIVFPPNSSMVFGLQNFSGYEPGIGQRTVDYANAAEGANAIRAERVLMPDKGLDSPLLDVFNVKYILTTHDRWQEEPQVDLLQDQVDVWLSLPPESSLEQRFTNSDAGLHRIDLMLDVAGDASGSVTAQVLTADGVLPLAHYDIDVSGVEGQGWQSFFFSPFSSEWGRTFLLRIQNNSDAELSLAASSEDLLAEAELLSVTDQAGDLAMITHYYPRPGLIFEEGKTRVYLNEGYLERAFVVPQRIIASSSEEALQEVQDRQSELDEVVVLELGNEPAPPDLRPGDQVSSTVRVAAYDLNRVALDVSTDQAGFLVLADTYYPGWKAQIDGVAVPVYQANYLMRAIYLPAGQHNVEFSFLPPDFLVGSVISAATVVAVLVLVVILQFTGRRRRSQTN